MAQIVKLAYHVQGPEVYSQHTILFSTSSTARSPVIQAPLGLRSYSYMKIKIKLNTRIHKYIYFICPPMFGINCRDSLNELKKGKSLALYVNFQSLKSNFKDINILSPAISINIKNMSVSKAIFNHILKIKKNTSYILFSIFQIEKLINQTFFQPQQHIN